MSEPVVEPALNDPPTTGNRVIDAALAELIGTEHASVAEQLAALAGAHEVLVQVLETSRDAVQTAIPGVRQGPDGRPIPGPPQQ